MAVEITMPQLSDTMDEGTILTWLKSEGESVERGDALAEVSTDKADLEIESFHEGTLLKIYSQVGDKVRVGEVIAVIGAEGESVSDAPAAPAPGPAAEAKVEAAPEPEAPTPAPAPEAVPAAAAKTAPPPEAAPAASNGSADRIKISPLARSLAKTHGIDYSQLRGSGEGGRITKRDIESQLSAQPVSVPVAASGPAPEKAASAPVQPSPGMQPLSKMRQTIANRMVESVNTIPHFYVTTRVQVDALTKLKNTLKPLPQYEGVTFNHLLLKATALALKAYPRINACFEKDHIVQPSSINIGIITAVPDGLLIPVVKNAALMPLADIVMEARGLVQRARAGRLKGDDLSGGTFSISNMGLFEVENFTAIINPGQGAILAVSSTQQEAVVVDGEIRPGTVMRLNLSVDHRIIDGVMAGEFLKELKRLIEDPVLLLA